MKLPCVCGGELCRYTSARDPVSYLFCRACGARWWEVDGELVSDVPGGSEARSVVRFSAPVGGTLPPEVNHHPPRSRIGAYCKTSGSGHVERSHVRDGDSARPATGSISISSRR